MLPQHYNNTNIPKVMLFKKLIRYFYQILYLLTFYKLSKYKTDKFSLKT